MSGFDNNDAPKFDTQFRSKLHTALADALRCALDGGLATVRVAGQSMAPTYRDGDWVRVERCLGEELVPGDIVLLDTEPLTLHRFVAHVGEDVVLAGDGNESVDPPRDAARVLGRVVEPRSAPRALPLLRWGRRACSFGARMIFRDGRGWRGSASERRFR